MCNGEQDIEQDQIVLDIIEQIDEVLVIYEIATQQAVVVVAH